MYKTLHSRRYQLLLTALIQARKDREVTQVDLAKRLRVEQSWISKCERGARRLDVVELEIWCQALGVSLSDFLKAYGKAAAAQR